MMLKFKYLQIHLLEALTLLLLAAAVFFTIQVNRMMAAARQTDPAPVAAEE